MERHPHRSRRHRARLHARDLGLALSLLLLAPSVSAQDDSTALLHADAQVVYDALAAGQSPEEGAWSRLLALLDEPGGLDDVQPETLELVKWSVYSLMVTPGPWTETVYDPERLASLRPLFERTQAQELGGHAEWWRTRDLMQRGRLKEAEAAALSGLEAWEETLFASQGLRVLLAELYHKQERWVDATDRLNEAGAELDRLEPDASWALEWRSTWNGVRGQVELSLGRLDQAALAFAAEQELAERYSELDPDLPPEDRWELLNIPRLRALDLLLVAQEYEQVLREVGELAQSPPERLLPLYELEASRGAALAELELRDPARDPRARAALQELIRDEQAPVHLRLGAAITRLRFEILSVDGADVEVHRLEANKLLGRWRDALIGREPIAERAMLTGLAVREILRDPASNRSALEPALDDLAAALQLVLDSFRATPILPGGIGFLHLGHRRSALGYYLEGCARLGDHERALALFLQADALGSLSRRAGLEAPDLAEVRRRLTPRGTGLLILLPTRDGTHLYALDEDRVVHAPGPPRHVISALTRDFTSDLRRWKDTSERALARIDALGELVAEALLPPAIAERIEAWDHVAVVGSSYFNDLEFEALPFGTSRLGLERAVSYLPSLTVGVELARRWTPAEAPDERGLFLVVAPAPGPEARGYEPALATLPFTERDWERLVAPFPVPARAGLRRDAATKAAFLAADLSGSRVSHLLLHGVHDRSRALPAGLAFSAGEADGEDLLWSEDLAGIKGSDVVVLSACGAARGPRRLGEDGITHLGGALFQGSTEAVVLASEDVEYHATLRLVELLHVELVRGVSLAEALRRARVKVASEWTHPFHALHMRVLGIGCEPVFLGPEFAPPPRADD